jgi:hypothetical protein
MKGIKMRTSQVLLAQDGVITTENSLGLEIKNTGNYAIQVDFNDVTDVTALTGNGGRAHVFTVTFPALAGATAGDTVLLPGVDNIAFFAVSLNVSGADPEPTSATWTSVPAGNKVHVDISAAVSAADVAAAVELAFDALTTEFATDDSAADGTMTFTNATRAPLSDGDVKNADGTGAGSITIASSVAGIASIVDIAANTLSFPPLPHGLITGQKVALTSTGTPPAGTSATNYYVIDAGTSLIKLATSVANALAGTAVNITDQGTANATISITPAALAGGAVKLQATLYDPSDSNAVWVDISGAAANLTVDTSHIFSYSNAGYPAVRAQFTLTAGVANIQIRGS